VRSWVVFFLLTKKIIGVAFDSATVGFTAADVNGVGPAILKTTDGAQTWTPCNVSFGIEVLLLDADVNGDVRCPS
jgi:hypothetical protein